MQNYILFNMKKLGLKEISNALTPITIQANPPSVVIDNENKVPAKYLTITPMQFTVNKKDLAAFLKTGAKVDYAHLEAVERLVLK